MAHYFGIGMRRRNLYLGAIGNFHDQGVDIVTVSKRLGHAKPDITLRVYAHCFRKDDAKAAAAINAAMKA